MWDCALYEYIWYMVLLKNSWVKVVLNSRLLSQKINKWKIDRKWNSLISGEVISEMSEMICKKQEIYRKAN